ncbi:MAG: hypothetical protein ACR2HJ_10660 [Fimbriimonadales bacterium]
MFACAFVAHAQTVPFIWIRPGLGAWPQQLSQTHDGTILAVSAGDGVLRFWRTSDGSPIGTSPVNAFSGIISGDGQTFLAHWGRDLRLYRISDATTVRILAGHTEILTDVDWSRDGILGASAAEDNTARLWDVPTGTLLKTLPHPDVVFNVSISPNKKFVATGCRDWFVRIWRVSDGALLRTLTGEGSGDGLEFSPDGTMLTACRSNAGGLRIWETSTWTVLRDVPGAENAATCTWYPSSQYIFSAGGASFGHVAVSRVADGNTRLWYTQAEHATCPVAVSTDAQQLFLGAGNAKHIYVYRESDGQLISTLGDHTGPVAGVAFSPDNALVASGSGDRSIQLFQAEQGNPLGVLGMHDDAVTSVAFSPDGQVVASASNDRSVRLWRVSDRTLIRTLLGHTNAVTSVAFSPTDPIIASASNDGSVRIWDSATGSLLRTLTTPVLTVMQRVRDVREVAFSSDGSFLAAVSRNGVVAIYRTSDFSIARLLTTPGVDLVSVRFSPDGQWLAAGGSDNTVRLWQLSGGPPSILAGFNFAVGAVAFTADNQFLIAGDRSNNGAIRSLLRVYRVSDGSLISNYDLETGGINDIATSPNGQWFALARHDSTVLMGPTPR